MPRRSNAEGIEACMQAQGYHAWGDAVALVKSGSGMERMLIPFGRHSTAPRRVDIACLG